MWNSPIYKLKTKDNKYIHVDVTTSCAPGLRPNSAIIEVVDFLRRKNVRNVLDFGAGAFRHTEPFIDAGFNVWAVEYERQFHTPICAQKRSAVEKRRNFKLLMFPGEFIDCDLMFDAAVLAFVLPTMPKRAERTKLLSMLKRLLRDEACIFWMSQRGKYGDALKDANRVGDGWYLHPKRQYHSFYTEFSNEQIDRMMKNIGFNMIRFLGKSGHDQFRLYSRKRGGWTWP